MAFEYLDNESEKLLEELLKKPSVLNENVGGTAIESLINNGYVKGVDCRSLSDLEPRFVLSEITHKGKSYFELKKKAEKDEKRLSHREWKIAIISAIIGALVGLIPSIIEWIK